MPDPVPVYQPENSFSHELGGSLDNLSEEIASLISDGVHVDPSEEGYGLVDLQEIPEEQHVFSGFLSGLTNFLGEVLGDAAWECTVYLGPLQRVYADRGITSAKDSLHGTQEAVDELSDDVTEALRSCSFIWALRIQGQLNYLFKGDLKRGVTWQGWEL